MENNNQTELFKLCPNCGAKCKSVYAYCNECGAALENISTMSANINTGVSNEENGASFTPTTPIPPKTEDTVAENVETAQSSEAATEVVTTESTSNEAEASAPPLESGATGADTNQAYQQAQSEAEPLMNRFFNGVSAEDMFNYTGKKPKLYGYLQRQQMSPTSKIFCLPLFLLGIFFGFFGMGCWYIYHKLYKQAAVFFGLNLFFFVIGIIGAHSIMESFTQAMSQMITSSSAELTDREIALMMQTILKGFPFVLNLLSYIGNLAQFVLAIVMPFYAYNTYRLTAIERINKARSTPYSPDLATVGGTAKGLLALAIGISIIITIIATAILMMPVFDMIIDLLVESPELFEDLPAGDFGMYGEYMY